MAYSSSQVSVAITGSTLLFQTSTGVKPDPPTAAMGGTAQVFRAHTYTDPLGVVIENLDAANPIWVGGSSVTATTGTRVAAGGSLSFSVTGNQSLYAVAGTAAVLTSVLTSSST